MSQFILQKVINKNLPVNVMKHIFFVASYQRISDMFHKIFLLLIKKTLLFIVADLFSIVI